MVPAPGQFARMVGALGVGNDSFVVFYDQKGLFSAARGWWMMGLFGHDRAAVLDGGLPKWLAEGRPVERGDAPPAPQATFRPDFRAARLRGIGDMLANLATAGELVLDARPAGRFSGKFPEPRAGMRSGHIPGAANLPFTELLAPDQTLLPPVVLRDRLAHAGVDGSRPVVTSCGSGVSACVLTLPWCGPGCRRERCMTGPGPSGAVAPIPRWRPDALCPRTLHAAPPLHTKALACRPRAGTHVHGFVNPAVHRGSTVLYPGMAERRDAGAPPLRPDADLRRPWARRRTGRRKRDRRPSRAARTARSSPRGWPP